MCLEYAQGVFLRLVAQDLDEGFALHQSEDRPEVLAVVLLEEEVPIIEDEWKRDLLELIAADTYSRHAIPPVSSIRSCPSVQPQWNITKEGDCFTGAVDNNRRLASSWSCSSPSYGRSSHFHVPMASPRSRRPSAIIRLSRQNPTALLPQ